MKVSSNRWQLYLILLHVRSEGKAAYRERGKNREELFP